MKRAILRLIARYGRAVTLHLPQGTQTMHAMLRPVTSKSIASMHREMDELGYLPHGMYLLLAPPNCPLEQAQWVECGGEMYLPRRVERLTLAEEEYYIWGLLTKEGTGDGELDCTAD